MRHRIPVVIGDQEYTVQHFMPTRALSVLTRLMKMGGSALQGVGKNPDEKIDSALFTAMGEIFSHLDEKELDRLMKELMTSAYKGDSLVEFETEFLGRPGLMFNLAFEIVKVQYKDFFDQIAGRLTAVAQRAKAMQATQSQNTSPSTG